MEILDRFLGKEKRFNILYEYALVSQLV